MCVRVCCAVHALWGILYTAAGSIQLVAGVFFLLSLPIFRMGSNICTGVCNVLIGVGTVMLSCFGDLNKQRSEKLILLTFLALGINVVNLVILEFGEWYLFLDDSVRDVINQHEFEELVYYARVSTSLTTLAVIAIAFVDSQLTYCSLQFLSNASHGHHPHINETVSDIDYIIPRHKTRSISSKQSHSFNQYTQSWVFDAETGTSSQNDSPYLKMPSAPIEYDADRCSSGKKHYAPSPVVRVQVDSGSETGDRQVNHMKSFSRTPSPSSPSPEPPVYECLERVTRLNTFAAPTTDDKPVRTEYAKPIREKVHYASLMVELEKSFVQKKECRLLAQDSEESQSEPSELHREPRGSDAEFSRELEAALKLIQDLESPNTIDTPSDTCRTLADELVTTNIDVDDESECSSKTLSGKHLNSLPVASSHSQSTSGYNSPSPSPEHPQDVAYVIRHMGGTAVISLYSAGGYGEVYSAAASDKVYVNKVHWRAEPVKKTKSMHELESRKFYSEGRNSKLRMWKLKRLLDRKRRPSLLPEVESAIVKSESLAFLTESELDERLRQTKHVHRQIEERLQKEMIVQRAGSFGSIEDVLEDASSVSFV